MTYSENELPGGSVVKNPPAGAGDASSIPGLRRSPEKETAAHSSTLAWEIPGTEEPGRLQSMGSQESGHDWATKQQHNAEDERLYHVWFKFCFPSCIQLSCSLFFFFFWLCWIFVAVWGLLLLQSTGPRARQSACGVLAGLLRGIWDLNSPTRGRTHVPCIGRWILNHWTVREVPSCSLLSTCYTFQLSQSYFGASSSFWMSYSVFVPKESHSICLILSHLTSHTQLKSAPQNVSHPVWWHLPI